MKLLGLEHETATAIYEQTNRRVEKVADIFFVGFIKVLPTCVFSPTFLLSFIKYLRPIWVVMHLNYQSWSGEFLLLLLRLLGEVNWRIYKYGFLFAFTIEGYYMIGIVQSDIRFLSLRSG